MKTLIINNKTFNAMGNDIMDGIHVLCDNRDGFVELWSNFTDETIQEFTYDGQVYYGSEITETILRNQDDGTIVACFRISLKSESDILQETVESLAQSAIEADAIDEWKADTKYAVGDIVSYNGSVYRVVQSHTSQSDWLPDSVPALYALLYKGTEPESEIPEWVQPDSTNPYMKGDKVSYNGEIYESLIDNNVWSPEAYPAGWQLIE